MALDALYVHTDLFTFTFFFSSPYLNFVANMIAEERAEKHNPHLTPVEFFRTLHYAWPCQMVVA